jgi:choline kinase
MRAIILAAGRARRLFPITHKTPKCLLTIGNSTLIDRLVQSLKEHGIKEMVVVVGFRAKTIIKHLTANHPDVIFKFINNKDYAKTNPSHSLWLASKYLKSDILYLNADVLCDPKIITNIIKSKKPSVTALQQNDWDPEEVNIIVNKKMQVLEIGKHIGPRESKGEFIGITKLSKHFNNHLRKILNILNKNSDRQKFAVDAINMSIKKGGILYALDVSRYKAHEIDTIEDYEFAQTLEL